MGPEPGMGDRIQRHRDSARCRRFGALGRCAFTRSWCCIDVREHGYCCY